jgi:hypothetical protein
MRKGPKVWWFILIGAILAASVAAIVHARRANQEEFHNKITALTAELSDGQSGRKELSSILNEPRFRGLILEDNSPNEWVVETPSEFGATNWVLYVEISDSKIVGLRVRTADSTNAHPRGAPADKYLLSAR